MTNSVALTTPADQQQIRKALEWSAWVTACLVMLRHLSPACVPVRLQVDIPWRSTWGEASQADHTGSLIQAIRGIACIGLTTVSPHAGRQPWSIHLYYQAQHDVLLDAAEIICDGQTAESHISRIVEQSHIVGLHDVVEALKNCQPMQSSIRK